MFLARKNRIDFMGGLTAGSNRYGRIRWSRGGERELKKGMWERQLEWRDI